MTWQKIAPLILISYIILKPLIIIRIILSRLIGALGGLNQTSLRKLIAYSSINHLSWILAAIYNSNIWLIYFIFYTFLTFSMIYIFNIFKISYINQLFSLFFNEKRIKFFLYFNLLSLGGLPPFLGFLPKILVIQSLTLNNQLFLLTFIVFITLITLYFYLRLCYRAFLLNYYENNWITYSNFNNLNIKLILVYSYISTFGLFLISSLFLF